jgi:hypothetical protein
LGSRAQRFSSDPDSSRESEPLTHTAFRASRQDVPRPSCRILFVDADESHGSDLFNTLIGRGWTVELHSTMKAAISRLKRPGFECEVVIVNVSDASQPWLRRLEMLQEAAHGCTAPVGPLILCVSGVKRDHLFELEIERRGGRLVYE